jgi:hypothetical protein
MRPPKALERPACRIGDLPLNDATGTGPSVMRPQSPVSG